MKTKISTQKYWILLGLAMLAIFGSVYIYRNWCRLFVTPEVSEYYEMYAHKKGYRTTFVQDYRVNDTLTLNATLIEGLDSASWQHLLQDFYVTPQSVIVPTNTDGPMSKSIRIEPPSKLARICPADKGKSMGCFLWDKKCLVIVHFRDDEQFHAIYVHLFNQLLKIS